MAVTIKSPQEIALMRDAGKILAEVHERLSEIIARAFLHGRLIAKERNGFVRRVVFHLLKTMRDIRPLSVFR